MFATLVTIALLGIACYVLVVVARTPPRRRSLAHPIQPRRNPCLVAVRRRRARRRVVARRLLVAAARRRRRSAPPSASSSRRPADEADRRARLHPERPVRPVLPRRPGRLLRRRGPRRSRSRTRSTRTSSRRSARARSTSASSDGTSVIPAVSQGIPIQLRRDDLRPVPVDRVRARRRRGINDAADLEGQEDRHPGQVRLVLDHAPGAARLGRA